MIPCVAVYLVYAVVVVVRRIESRDESSRVGF